MLDGRRHSVDIPISKALLALRRVKSLRDPTTNSLSKFCAAGDNVNLETNSNDGISLKFVSSFHERGSDNGCLSGSKNIHIDGERGQHVADSELYNGLRKSDRKVIRWVDSDSEYCGSNEKEIYGNKSLSERYGTNHRGKGWDFTGTTPLGNYFEDEGSCNEPIVGSPQVGRIEHAPSNRKLKHKSNQIKSSQAVGDVLSRVGSPCLSGSDVMLEKLSHSSLFVDDGVDIDCNNHGCGCCWSRNPRFSESKFHSELEGHPLLSGEEAETVPSGQGRGWKNVSSEMVPMSESPRSLNQKFRPRSFSELVGHNVVARSLLSAISNERITSFYLFHGPRGTGKTSAAKIFAAALNCLSLEEQRPCGLCEECVLFFSGGSRDVKEVDSVRINRTDRVITLIKSAVNPPVSSRYKVFIVDECQLLRGETWVSLLSSLEGLPQHAVFVMITADLDKLPRGAMSRSQRYHFPKIKDADIASRLGKICVQECLDFDQVALEFIAAKANGSLRDAEMMLDQLSLLGKRITISLAHELIGIVSDDELLELLDLAFSSDTSNTVRRARELMRSRIDPMQLISQLANLVMDILAGPRHDGAFEVRRKFSERCRSEAAVQKLSHALKVLSEAEKQLRTSKNQTTWLTVALLQLSCVEVSSLDTNESSAAPGVATSGQRVGDFRCTSSSGKSLKHPVTGECENAKSYNFGSPDYHKEKLDSIWRRATEICQSNTLKNFLRKRGTLSSIRANQGLAIAELQFCHPDYVARAEKSWKVIASSLQSILNCNVEIRINLVPLVSTPECAKVKKSSFSLFSCSWRMQHKCRSTNGSDQSDYSDIASEKAMIKGKPIEPCSPDHGSPFSEVYYRRCDSATTIRDGEGNALSTRATSPLRPSQENMQKCPGARTDASKKVASDSQWQILSSQEPENQPSCLCRSVKFCSSNTSQKVCLGNKSQYTVLSIPRKTRFNGCLCATESYKLCDNSSNCINSSGDIDRQKNGAKVHCWDALACHSRKVGLLKQEGRRSHLARCLFCASAE